MSDQHGGGDAQYAKHELAAAALFGAAVAMAAVGMEAIGAHYGAFDAGSQAFWVVPGVLTFVLSLMYAQGWEALPGVGRA